MTVTLRSLPVSITFLLLAGRLAALAKLAGMRYIIFTAK